MRNTYFGRQIMRNAEGYCAKCGKPLSITGVCYACKDEELNERFKQNVLRRAFTCPICGLPKVHHRLHGYRCSSNPEHDEQVSQMSEQEITEAFRKLEELK